MEIDLEEMELPGQSTAEPVQLLPSALAPSSSKLVVAPTTSLPLATAVEEKGNEAPMAEPVEIASADAVVPAVILKEESPIKQKAAPADPFAVSPPPATWLAVKTEPHVGSRCRAQKDGEW